MSWTEGSGSGATRARSSHRPAPRLALLLALVLLPAACGDDGDAGIRASQSSATTASTAAPAPEQPSSSMPASSSAAASSSPTSADPTTRSSTPAAAMNDERVEAAIADLADRRGYSLSEISVVRVEPVTWPNGALGCPTKDGQYTQATVEGYRIILAWKGVEYRYHGAVGALPFWCQYLDQ